MYVRTYYRSIIATNKPINQWRESYSRCGEGWWSTDSADHVYIYICTARVCRARVNNEYASAAAAAAAGRVCLLPAIVRRADRYFFPFSSSSLLSKCTDPIPTDFRRPFPGVPDDEHRTEETKNRVRINTTRLNRRRRVIFANAACLCIMLFTQPAMK